MSEVYDMPGGALEALINEAAAKREALLDGEQHVELLSRQISEQEEENAGLRVSVGGLNRAVSTLLESQGVRDQHKLRTWSRIYGLQERQIDDLEYLLAMDEGQIKPVPAVWTNGRNAQRGISFGVIGPGSVRFAKNFSTPHVEILPNKGVGMMGYRAYSPGETPWTTYPEFGIPEIIDKVAIVDPEDVVASGTDPRREGMAIALGEPAVLSVVERLLRTNESQTGQENDLNARTVARYLVYRLACEDLPPETGLEEVAREAVLNRVKLCADAAMHTTQDEGNRLENGHEFWTSSAVRALLPDTQEVAQVLGQRLVELHEQGGHYMLDGHFIPRRRDWNTLRAYSEGEYNHWLSLGMRHLLEVHVYGGDLTRANRVIEGVDPAVWWKIAIPKIRAQVNFHEQESTLLNRLCNRKKIKTIHSNLLNKER